MFLGERPSARCSMRLRDDSRQHALSLPRQILLTSSQNSSLPPPRGETKRGVERNEPAPTPQVDDHRPPQQPPSPTRTFPPPS